MPDTPSVEGVISAADVVGSARYIAEVQEPSGAIPWYRGGHVDPWDHVESAMALTAAGLRCEAEHAYEWSRHSQRADGSWPIQVRAGEVEDAGADTNFCAYLAVGVWHHLSITGDMAFGRRMWPCVRSAIDFVLGFQRERGEIAWAVGPGGDPLDTALVTGCSSIHQSLRCALALAELMDSPQPSWEVAVGRLGHALRAHPEAFAPKQRFSMDWYYPILGGAMRGNRGRTRLLERWSEFVVDDLGVRCVMDHPWVTGAETCELVLSLDALGWREAAMELLAAMQHLRDADGSYWTGLVYTDGKNWPVEHTTWTAAAVILAADALARTTPGSGIFRADRLPLGLEVDGTECGCPERAHLSGDTLQHP